MLCFFPRNAEETLTWLPAYIRLVQSLNPKLFVRIITEIISPEMADSEGAGDRFIQYAVGIHKLLPETLTQLGFKVSTEKIDSKEMEARFGTTAHFEIIKDNPIVEGYLVIEIAANNIF